MEAVAPHGAFVTRKSAEQSYTQRALLRFRRNRMAVISVCILTVFGLAAALAGVLAPYDPNAIDLSPTGILQPPSRMHPFGTDEMGRDGFSRALYGARISLTVGFVATAMAVTIGTIVGTVAGIFGGWVDTLLMRTVDILLSIPLFFLIMIAQTLVEPNIYNVMIIIGITSWMEVASGARRVSQLAGP